MMHGRRSERWDHTAEIAYILVAVNHDPKQGKPPRRSDFHPYQGADVSEGAERLRMEPTTGINALASMLGAKNGS